jgi:cyclophilin family peptidyl-prolyl cis-trans isomerase
MVCAPLPHLETSPLRHGEVARAALGIQPERVGDRIGLLRGSLPRSAHSPRQLLTIAHRHEPLSGDRLTLAEAARPLKVILFGSVACGEREPGPREGIPVVAPALRPADGLVESALLMEVVDLGIDRDGEALRGWLAHEEPEVRARAAFALGSVQHQDAAGELAELLRDPSPPVRRDAAFALGQLDLEDGGESLVEALAREEDPEVRAWLLEALGRAGGEDVLGRLVEMGAGPEEAAWTLALARAAVRNLYPEGSVQAMLERLTHPDPEVREVAAYSFGRGADRDAMGDQADRVREALDGYLPDEPAAMHLVLALARRGHRADLDRLLHWLEEAEDWRIRANVARGLGATVWLEADGVRGALVRALQDDSQHVGVAAGRALLQGLWVPPQVHRAMEASIGGPAARWRTHAPLLRELAHHHDPDPVLEWSRRMVDENPVAVTRGLEALADIPGPGISEFVREMAAHPHPRIRAGAFGALSRRWPGEAMTQDDLEELYELFATEVMEGPTASALHAVGVLVHPSFLAFGSPDALREAYRQRRQTADIHLLSGLLDALTIVGDPASMERVESALEDEDYRIRRAAARALEVHDARSVPDGVVDAPDPERRVDWELLASLGPEPRLRIRTDRGEMVVRLAPEQAPLTVQTMAEQAREGLQDGVFFHRVEPNFVIQAGDFSVGDGRGGPGYAIRSEFTQIPFRRGMLGMASSGKDTEGSQYFLLHSMQPHLDGDYTSFGWLESGWDVLDRILEGDRVLGMTVEPSPDE